MGKWFLIYCKPGQDTRAEQNLIRQGFKVFRPVIQVVKSKIGCKDVVRSESLFPRYIFIRVDPEARSISPVLSTFGVSNFVRFGDNYATAPDAMIEEIRSTMEKHKALSARNNALENGDEVYVSGAGFDQVRALYLSPCGEKRAMILLNILGKESHLVVPKEYLTKKAISG